MKYVIKDKRTNMIPQPGPDNLLSILFKIITSNYMKHVINDTRTNMSPQPGPDHSLPHNPGFGTAGKFFGS